MTIQFGKLSLDEDLVVKQLRQDLKDDWFPDPIGFSDFEKAGLLPKIIQSNLQKNGGKYVPQPATLLNVPKSNFTLRYALETGLSDRAIYHTLAVLLLPRYDQLISKWVFSHRCSVGRNERRGNKEKYVFRNGVEAWNDFLGCVRSSLEPGKFLLSTDLANYFENINLKTLRSVMIDLSDGLSISKSDKVEVRKIVKQLFGYLSSWSFTTERGLPQNRDASSFLANMYMRSVDSAMLCKGYAYFRYMDDIKIVCDSESAARAALKDLVINLRPIGQSVNGGKTRIVRADDVKSVEECLDAPSMELKRINSAWQSKALGPISRSFIPLQKFTMKILSAGEYTGREFRFCIARLEALARCTEFAVPKEYFDVLTAPIIEGLDKSPVATDQICRYLRAAPLSADHLDALATHVSDETKTIYNWKNYRLWILLTQKEHRTDGLLDRAREIVVSRPDDPTRAGATVYLGAFGAKQDRELIAERFTNLQSFLGQRSAIIAVQELHYRTPNVNEVSIERNCVQFLREDLIGSYRALGRRGTYFEKLEPVSISKFVDMERDYD